MGCCVSKKSGERPAGAAGEVTPRRRVVEARDLPPPPEEEKVKEVLSETPRRVRPRARPRRVAGAEAPSVEVERGGEKDMAKGGGRARVKDGSGRVSRPAVVGVALHATEEKSEAASESSAATTVAGPERSPGKMSRRRQDVSGELGRSRRERVRASAVAGAGRPAGGRASPSPPPPRRDPGRRSPSPAAKRTQEQRRAAAAAAAATSASCTQRKPPVPARTCGRASPRRAQEAAPPQLPPPLPAAQRADCCVSPPPPHPLEHDDSAVAAAGDGKESLENPQVAMECFIFL